MVLEHCDCCCNYTENRPFSDNCAKCGQPRARKPVEQSVPQDVRRDPVRGNRPS
jgi:hypothetical protein